MASSPILILGAGIGGLSAAIRLAAKGHKVIILEKNSTVGGKMSEVRAAGFRWDTGPSVLTMRHVFEDLFQAAGRQLEDYVALLPVEPLTRYHWADGVRLDLSRDLYLTAQQISALSSKGTEDYLTFLSKAARLHRITAPVFTYGPPPSLASLRHIHLKDALHVDPIHTLQWYIERNVHEPHLRQLLGRFATYVGASPYLAPATLAVIAHVELTEGVWYPQGGMYAIARAYERLALELGVEIRLDCRVQEIHVSGQRVSGVVLENGENLSAHTIISNLDVTTTYSLLPSKRARQRLKNLQEKPVSCSGVILLLGIEGNHLQLAHHNIFFSSDYRQEFHQIFNENRLPEDPTVYLCITSKTDPSHAPAGCENWFVMVNSPALPIKANAPDLGDEEMAAYILSRLARFDLDVRGRIRYQRVLTPRNIEQGTGAYRGALYGISFNDRFAPFKRPHNRSEIQGLYFVGGTTHPGGGIPLVTLSGKLVANMVEEDKKKFGPYA